MSKKELNRAELMLRIQERKLTQRKAAEMLGLSVRRHPGLPTLARRGFCLYEPNILYDATTQTVDREFLLKPTLEVRNILGACLGRAQRAFPVDLHYALANVNHPHLGVSAPDARLHLIEPFFNLSMSLIARELTALLSLCKAQRTEVRGAAQIQPRRRASR